MLKIIIDTLLCGVRSAKYKGTIIIGIGFVFVIVCLGMRCHNDTAARKTNLQFVCKLKSCSYLQNTFNIPLTSEKRKQILWRGKREQLRVEKSVRCENIFFIVLNLLLLFEKRIRQLILMVKWLVHINIVIVITGCSFLLLLLKLLHLFVILLMV